MQEGSQTRPGDKAGLGAQQSPVQGMEPQVGEGQPRGQGVGARQGGGGGEGEGREAGPSGREGEGPPLKQQAGRTHSFME